MKSFLAVSLILACLSGFAQPPKKGKKNKQKQLTESPAIDPNAQRQLDLDFVDASMEMLNGSPVVAADIFQRILKNHPKHHASMYNLMLIYEDPTSTLTNYEEAVRLGEAALKEDPNNYWYYVALVEAYRKKGDLPNAIAKQELVVKKFPKEKNAKNTLVDLYVKNKQYDKALLVLNELEAAQPLAADEWGGQKYRLLMEMGKYEETLTLINKLIKQYPEKLEFYYNKYNLLNKLNRTAEGIALLKYVLTFNPNDSFCLLNLADYYKNQQNLAESDKYLFLAFASPDISPDGKLGVIQNMQNAKDKDADLEKRTQQLIRIFTQAHPDHADTYLLLGDYYMGLGKTDSARTFYRKAADKDNAQISLWEKLIEADFRLHNLSQLSKDTNDALEVFPNSDKLTYYWGMSFLEQKEYELAMSAFEKIRRRNRAEPLLTARVHAAMGLLLMQKGNLNEAEDNFKKAYNLAENDPLVLANYSRFCVKQQNLDKAKELANKALRLAAGIPETQHAMAVVLAAGSDYSGALTYISQAATQYPHPDYYEFWGDILLKLNRKPEAIEKWQKAIELGNKELDIAAKSGGR